MSLGLVPLALFLLAACREDVRTLTLRYLTLLVWGAVALAGWWQGAWALDWRWSLLCFGLLTLAGTGRGDRYGGLLVGAWLGALSGPAVALALAGVWSYCWRRHRAPDATPFYPFLSAAIAVIIGLQVVVGFVRGSSGVP